MTIKGTLFLVVGRSGVGKDSILDGARVALREDADFVFACRTITRDRNAGGETFDAVTPEEFSALDAEGRFFASWQAHGLSYGLPASLIDQLKAGQHVVANVSRAALGEIVQAYPNSIIVEISANPETIAARLKARKRETDDDIAARMTRAVPDFPADVDVISVRNEDDLESAVHQFTDAVRLTVNTAFRLRHVPIDTWRDNICYLHADSTVAQTRDYLGSGKVDVSNGSVSIRAKVNVVEGPGLIERNEIGLSTAAFNELGLPQGAVLTIERTPSPESLAALRQKIAGQALTAKQIDTIIRDISEDRYLGREISAFLVAASEHLEIDEIEHLTRARAKYSTQMSWPKDLVVDKHSMGGVPGSRISMIVVPIVAASGLIMPKTSSRAITSAAGTADAMEAIARVDLPYDEVQDVVEKANGCIVWNGALSHSAVDDVMNSITRPLGIDSTKWAAASIISKKLAAGSTHVIIDLPTGPGMKTSTEEEARSLGRLFETIGNRVGLDVIVKVTDGSMPIGRGIGPALEVRDVYQVLGNDDGGPADLREKALEFAGSILEWNPEIAQGQGRTRAEELLNSGAALASLERIVDAQGRLISPAKPGRIVRDICAHGSGRIGRIDAKRISKIARRAGAPMDKSAGVDLCRAVGDDVLNGGVLFRIHGSVEGDVIAAEDEANASVVYEVV